MTTFVDTSALIALLDGSQPKHGASVRAWKKLLDDDLSLVTTSYVLVETYALAQRRLGMEAVRILTTDFVPLFTVDWVDEPIHGAAVASLLTANRRELSLVDCVSFEVMRRRDITHVFAIDADFSKQGFTVVP